VTRGASSFQFEDHSLLSSDGESSLFVRHYYRGKPKYHFIITHGALEHSGRHYEQVQYWFKQYGQDLAVTVYDHVGHGRSGGHRAYVPAFKVYVHDLMKVGEFVQTKNDDKTKTFICAHSLGGLIALTCILNPAYGWNFPLSGLIFSSPCVRPRLILGSSSEPFLEKLDKVASKFHLPLIYKGTDLTRDPERANDFDTDSLIPKFLTVRMAREIIEGSHQVRGLSYYLRIPSLFLVAGEDRIVDPESTTLFAHGIDKRLTSVIQYPKHHHELWNELDRQSIFDTMKKWVDARLKESP
jgi:alpha-beta hydrolase superfamily lysophospholipase